MPTPELITTTAAADLLGVRRETVYAYVSRGVLQPVRRTDEHGHRGSLFDRAAVQELAGRRRRTRAGSFELQIDTAVTELDPAGRLFYRGHDVTDLVGQCSYEHVAELLWQTGCEEPVWSPDTAVERVVEQVSRLDLAEVTPAARVRAALALLAAQPDDGSDAPSEARRAIVTAARCAGPRPVGWQGGVAATLTTSLTGAARPGQVALLDEVMTLVADHELATSTVATRAAASTRAPLPTVLLAGAAALAGPLHGAASREAESLVRHLLADGIPSALDGRRRVPGFGHKVYVEADPRAEHLLARVRERHPETGRRLDGLTIEVLRRHSQVPNVDLGLAAVVLTEGLPTGAGEALFLTARLAGLTAHALEEREHSLRFRPRALYTGSPRQAETD